MKQSEIKMPPIADCGGLGMYLIFLLSNSVFKSDNDSSHKISEKIKQKAHELAKETKRKIDYGECEKFDYDGELATDNELFKAYTEDLLRLVTLGHIEKYTTNNMWEIPLNAKSDNK